MIDSYEKDLQEGAYKEVLKDLYKRSLYNTTNRLLGYRDVTTTTHGLIIKTLKSERKKKLIVVPRGCFKSSICSISYPIWLLLRDPNLRILLDSELFSNSSRFLREIKGHLEHPSVTSIFGEFKGPVWNDSEIVIRQRTRNVKEASITCSGIGAQKTSQHYEYIIADDMNSPSNSFTPELRDKVIDHYRQYISLLEPGGTIVVVGTRYAYSDLIGFILENELGLSPAGFHEKQKGLLPNLKTSL